MCLSLSQRVACGSFHPAFPLFFRRCWPLGSSFHLSFHFFSSPFLYCLLCVPYIALMRYISPALPRRVLRGPWRSLLFVFFSHPPSCFRFGSIRCSFLCPSVFLTLACFLLFRTQLLPNFLGRFIYYASYLRGAYTEHGPRYSAFQCDIDWLGVRLDI